MEIKSVRLDDRQITQKKNKRLSNRSPGSDIHVDMGGFSLVKKGAEQFFLLVDNGEINSFFFEETVDNIFLKNRFGIEGEMHVHDILEKMAVFGELHILVRIGRDNYDIVFEKDEPDKIRISSLKIMYYG